MRYLTTIILFILLIPTANGQIDYLEKFKTHKFPCDKDSTTAAINICSGIQRKYADSLMNVAYLNILSSLTKNILVNRNKLKNEISKKGKKNIKLQIIYNKQLLKSIIKSQKKWIALRYWNTRVANVDPWNGIARPAMENYSFIDETLERIRKLQEFDIGK